MNMNMNDLNGVDDWLNKAESVVTGAGKIKTAYDKAVAKRKPVIAQVEPTGINLDTTMKLYLAAGGIALIAWFWLMRK